MLIIRKVGQGIDNVAFLENFLRFDLYLSSAAPSQIRWKLVFWHFQGLQKEIIRMKCVNKQSGDITQNKMFCN